jgi:hypothetical protein
MKKKNAFRFSHIITYSQKVGFSPASPSSGAIVDMEAMTLDTKLTFLREHSLWKVGPACMRVLFLCVEQPVRRSGRR